MALNRLPATAPDHFPPWPPFRPFGRRDAHAEPGSARARISVGYFNKISLAPGFYCRLEFADAHLPVGRGERRAHWRARSSAGGGGARGPARQVALPGEDR